MYAEKTFQLDKKLKGSESTLREHLQAIETQTGITPEELHNPEPSPAVAYLLGWFFELAMSRQSGMSLNPISYAEIEAWNRLFSRHLEQWEIRTIKQLDMIYLNVQQTE
ncbi:phage tail assembly chaperone [Mannheimia pernigra]|uniref:phage tail assembly chaperone n=1 Tax=Mannheimia pernigra TaxID=111844 RepID=UPI00159F4F27|nr:hypothetical protein [Mannheimia pernigra]QLB44479.1 hypothetical protein HV561_06855 [Mannheimia pernigra]